MLYEVLKNYDLHNERIFSFIYTFVIIYILSVNVRSKMKILY